MIKRAWCWNDEVKQKVKEKHETYAVVINTIIEEERVINKGRYQAMKKVTKKVISRKVRRMSLSW